MQTACIVVAVKWDDSCTSSGGVQQVNYNGDECSVNITLQEGLAVASIARDDPSPLPGMHRDPMHFRHRQTDTDIVA